MNKLLLIIAIILLFSVSSVSADLVIDMKDYGSVTEALEAVPMDAGNVTLKLSRINLKESDAIINIPFDRNIKDFFIYPEGESGTVSLPDLERICANGVPLTIGAGLNLENTSIYGGICVSGEEASLESSAVTIEGSVGFVFGGGFAENGGTSAVSETSVTLTKTGLVYYEIFGGGHAYGEGSQVRSEHTVVHISGTADYALGGGFAEDGGTSECVRTDVNVEAGASIPVALFSGGSASGPGSLSTVENAKAVLEGQTDWAFSGDFAFGGGTTRLERASRLEISETGTAGIAYMGSFSSDEGSDAFVNTSELMVCGTASQIVQNSQSTDRGEAKTLIKALFPCK